VKLRQNTLLKGIQALLNDRNFTGLAKELYNQALVNPLSQGTATAISTLASKPAYIKSDHFALALVSILEEAHQGQPLDQTIAAVEDQQLKSAMMALWSQAKGDRDKFISAVGNWFDAAMDRLSGWYKRYSQALNFLSALLICAVLDADALRVARDLWHAPVELHAATLPSGADAMQTMTQMNLLGWSGSDLGSWADRVVGWAVVAFASLFGAPFWFDTLQRATQLAGTGPSPAVPKDMGVGAA
jgi:hypothetical protein